MKILSIANPQQNNEKQAPSFGIFISTENKVIPLVEELVGDVLALSDVVKKGGIELDSNGTKSIGDYLTQRERDLYSNLKEYFCTPQNMSDLTSAKKLNSIRIPDILRILVNMATSLTAKDAEAALAEAKADGMSEEAVARAIKKLRLND